MLDYVFREHSENLGILYRQKMGLLGYEPLLAFSLAEFLKVRLLNPNDLDTLDHQIRSWLLSSENWWAVTVPVEPLVIIYNPNQPDTRFESTVMHELAHLILNHKAEELVILSSLFNGRNYPKRQEEEAKYLGSCLQVSKICIDWMKQEKLSFQEATHYFGCSSTLLQYRLNMTGNKFLSK